MLARKLAVAGAYEFTPKVFPDDRGLFVSPFQEAAFAETIGAPLFPVAQTNLSISRRGVARGIHFTTTPPGNAKFVYCVQGKVIDYVVDLRVGSPTFGQWDSVLMDTVSFHSSYLPVGVGHAFVALEDDSAMSYMLSQAYDPQIELAVDMFDPTIALSLPDDIEPVLSARDKVAPTLVEALAANLLPGYARSMDIEMAMNLDMVARSEPGPAR